jgi:hypothetical protein
VIARRHFGGPSQLPPFVFKVALFAHFLPGPDGRGGGGRSKLIAPSFRLPLSLPGTGRGCGLGCAGGRPPLLSAINVLRLIDTLSAITRRSSV